MALPSDFFTRQRANEGEKLAIIHPNGTESEHYLIVRSVDSDHYRKARDEAMREALKISTMPSGDDRDEAMQKVTIDTLASLIVGWSFEVECNEESIREFLIESPGNADRVDKFAADRARFFTKPVTTSTTTPEASSS